MSGVNLDGYNDVASRLQEFREKHPDGSLQPANLAEPFRVVEVDGKTFITYTAAAYRSPDDQRPGIGVAWELVPGKTPYTKDSELQNAETSAWGRAIVAALAADMRKGIATREEVRAREETRPERVPGGKLEGGIPTVEAIDKLDSIDAAKALLGAASGAFRKAVKVELGATSLEPLTTSTDRQKWVDALLGARKRMVPDQQPASSEGG